MGHHGRLDRLGALAVSERLGLGLGEIRTVAGVPGGVAAQLVTAFLWSPYRLDGHGIALVCHGVLLRSQLLHVSRIRCLYGDDASYLVSFAQPRQWLVFFSYVLSVVHPILSRAHGRQVLRPFLSAT